MSAATTEISNVCYPKLDSGNELSSDDSQFSIVGRRPGVHNILPTENFEEAAIFPSLESDVDDDDIENESVMNVTDLESSSNENCRKEGKSGTLKRILRNLTRSSKSGIEMKETEKSSSNSELDVEENVTPNNEENITPNNEENITPNNEENQTSETNVTEGSEKTSKDSKTSISKTFQKLSGALSRNKTDCKEKPNTSNQDLKEDKEKRNSLSRRFSNLSAHLIKSDKDKDNNSKHNVSEEKEKRNSLSRRLSNISGHLPKLSSHKAETASLNNQPDNSESETKTNQLKRCPSDKSSTTLGKRLSSISSHFRFRGVSNPGSGEAGNISPDVKLEKDSVHFDVSPDIKVEKDSVELNEKKEIG